MHNMISQSGPWCHLMGGVIQHTAMEHYLVACGLRSYVCRGKETHSKHFKQWGSVNKQLEAQYTPSPCSLKKFISKFMYIVVNPPKSPIKESKTNVVMRHHLCTKFSLSSPFQTSHTSAFHITATSLLGDKSRTSLSSISLSLSLSLFKKKKKSHFTIAPSCPPDPLPPITAVSWGSWHRTRIGSSTATNRSHPLWRCVRWCCRVFHTRLPLYVKKKKKLLPWAVLFIPPNLTELPRLDLW